MIILSFLLFVVGVVVWLVRSGCDPESLSALVYEVPSGMQWVWVLWMEAVAFSMAPCLLDVLPEGCEVFGWLMVVCLMLCGGMPLVRNEENRWHYLFAIMAGVLSQLCVVLLCPWWLLLWVLYLACLPFIGSRWCFWVEVACAVGLYGCLWM